MHLSNLRNREKKIKYEEYSDKMKVMGEGKRGDRGRRRCREGDYRELSEGDRKGGERREKMSY
jgi:hypothetical protein